MNDHLHAEPKEVSRQTDAKLMANWIRACRHVDRGQLLEELIAAFPDFTAEELQCAINARTRPRPTRAAGYASV